ncbi:hypothetical protein OG897_07580 [Streptomyces sp. NBC_00237]|uniref:hypothetical protein n=1 Tax=Streptomyces sp. NBC_00237 TaxID=2975687 RepID=UPI00224DA29F|nr:hypothetical protein [Streptomyces sp. NBC_00237]MCX5201314.1 hypothetical protein [Streptomyces sp. NBC_00237]
MSLNRPRLLGAVAGVALLIGGAFTAQAVADSGPKPAPKVTSTGDAAPAPASAPASTPAKGGVTGPKVVTPGTPKGVSDPGPAPAGKSGDAPRVIKPGRGVAHAPAPAPQK